MVLKFLLIKSSKSELFSHLEKVYHVINCGNRLWSHETRLLFAPLQKSRGNHRILCVNRSPIRCGFRAGAEAIR